MCDPRHLAGCVKAAVDQLYHDDRQLLQGRAHEVSITARLARYLEQQLPGWAVDVEYNRDAHDRDDVKRDGDRRPMRPDVIVHERRADRNVLAIEVKPHWSAVNRGRDVSKLAHLTGAIYAYRLGVLIELAPEEASYRWFAGGREVVEPSG